MKAKLIREEQGSRTFVLVFDTGEEAVSGLEEFVKMNNIVTAQVAAIGAFSDTVLGWFSPESNTYKRIPINEQVEVVALLGNVTLYEGKPRVHVHVTLTKADGTAHGGHLMSAHVRPTLEVFISELPETIERKIDQETTLPLIKL
jgi:predicted DNA-binding protein with PD1-like motif